MTNQPDGASLSAQVTQTRRALLRVRDRQELLNEACRLAVETGGFRMAWIGWVEHAAAIVPVASAGHVDGYLDGIRITIDGTTGEGPSGRAVRSGQPQVCQDILHDPTMTPWREAALVRGYRSSGAFPLRDNGNVVGMLAVYADEPGRFDEQATSQLWDLANDLAITVLLRDQQAARLAAERRYRDLFEHAAEGIFRTGLDGRTLEANPAMAAILGYASPDELLAMVPQARDLYVDRARRDELITELRARGEVHDFEIQQLRKDGRPVWLSVSARLVFQDDGTPDGLEGFAVDISARRRAVQELLASRERFRQTFSHAPLGMAIVGLDGQFVEVNASLCAILGREPEELVGLTFQEITHPDDLDEDLQYVERLLSGELGSYEMRKRYLHADGYEVPVRLVGSVVRGGDGAPLHFVAQVEDVSDRLRAEVEIRHREAILAAVSDLAEALLSGGHAWSKVLQVELGRLASAAGADRAAVIELVATEDGGRAIRRPIAWAVDGVDALLDDPRLDGLPYEAAGFGTWAATLAAGGVLNVRVEEGDPSQRALLEDLGTRTVLFAPVHVNGAWWGAINLEGVVTDRSWSDIEVDALQAAARVLGAAIAHERALQEIESRDRRLTDLVETVPVGVTFVDATGQLTFANAGAEAILRLDRSEIAGRAYDDPAWRIAAIDGGPFPESDLPFVRVSRERTSVRGVQHAIEHADGTRTLLSINGVPLFDADGEFTGMVATIEDITARRASELARERLATIVESSSDAILAKTLDGIITDWNAGAETVYGHPASEAVGRHVSLVVPEDRLGELAEMHGRVRAGEVVRNVVTERVRSDGETIWVSLTVSPLRDGSGRVIGMSTIARDVTDEIRAKEQLTRYATELQRSNQELEQFAYVASHDLQEPLRMVTSFLELLARRYEGQLDDQADQYIHFAVDGATRMRSLIEDLLSFSRVGTRGEQFSPVDLDAVVDDVLTDLRTTMGETAATVDVGPLPVVRGDASQLRQVFLNLIGNALKFHDGSSPHVHVHADRGDDAWTITVADDGIGIPPEHAERVFVIFQRLHARDAYPGTGMGLAICKKIVERHGGRIWVDTAQCPGTTIRLTLPLHVEDHES